MGQDLETIQRISSVVAEFLVKYAFQILGALIILLVGGKLAAWTGRAVGKLCEKKGLDVTLSRFFGNAVKVLVLVFVVILAIGKFGISIAPFVAALGALIFGGSFALAGPLSNFGAGLVIILSRPFVVGDTITVQGVSGVVEEIRLAATLLSSEDGEAITIPNKHIVGEVLRNSFASRLVETTLGISYEDDPQRAIAAIEQALAGIGEVGDDPAPLVGIQNFGDSAIEIGLRYWVPTKQYFPTRYRVNLSVHKALAEAGITIPFPQREVRLKSGVGD